MNSFVCASSAQWTFRADCSAINQFASFLAACCFYNIFGIDHIMAWLSLTLACSNSVFGWNGWIDLLRKSPFAQLPIILQKPILNVYSLKLRSILISLNIISIITNLLHWRPSQQRNNSAESLNTLNAISKRLKLMISL